MRGGGGKGVLRGGRLVSFGGSKRRAGKRECSEEEIGGIFRVVRGGYVSYSRQTRSVRVRSGGRGFSAKARARCKHIYLRMS